MRKGRLVAVLSLLSVLAVLPVRAAPQPFLEHTIDAGLRGARLALAADLDGDGDLDVVGVSHADWIVGWWENDGSSPPDWTEHRIESDLCRPVHARATDVNVDGRMDVLAACHDGIVWWENRGGNPPSWSRHEVDADLGSVRSVYATDVDNDGDVDVLGTGNHFDRWVAWWESRPGAGGGGFPLH